MLKSNESLLNDISYLLDAVREKANEVSVVVVTDDPEILEKKPALRSTKYVERLNSEAELSQLLSIFHKNNIACKIIFGFNSFLDKAIRGTLFSDSSTIKAVMDKTEGGGHKDGFGPARRSTGGLICNLFGYTYLHADAYSAAISRHKYHQSLLLEKTGILVPKTWSYDAGRGWFHSEPDIGEKIICKSTFEAWSIGVSESTVGQYDNSMKEKIDILSKSIGQPVCVQEFIEGPEIYCVVLGLSRIACVGIAEVHASSGPKKNGEYLVFEDHYRPGGMVYTQPRLNKETIHKIQKSTKDTFKVLGMSGIGRIDFRVDKKGDPYVIDIADNPGTSSASSLAYIMNSIGIEHDSIPLIILGIGLDLYAK